MLITVNSTAAVEAMPLDVPALVVGLPNNLSPFVEAGAVAGAATPAEIGPMLRAVLYDKEFRARLTEARQAFMARYQIAADGRAAVRAAESIVRLAADLTGLHSSETAMRALITGGAGFVGSHLAELLLGQGHEVFVLDNLSTGSMDNIVHLKGRPALPLHHRLGDQRAGAGGTRRPGGRRSSTWRRPSG